MQQHRAHGKLPSKGRASRLRHGAAVGVTLGLVACFGGCEASEGSNDETAPDVLAAGPGTDVPTKPDEQALPKTVDTALGTVSGEIADEGGKPVRVFRGIPYAAAPTGELRWKPPQPAQPWSGVRDATKWGDRCPQGESTLSSPGSTSEDCLNLSVLTPVTRADERVPVMVFFHGGGLSVGTGNSPVYGHTALPAQGVVTVLVNHRLGPFGYFSHPALAKESDRDASGNYGSMDLVASLQWVQKNIEAFGGDPKNVTIFGESGGGSKVLSCMASPQAKGLFHRAMIQSGSRSSAPGAVSPRATAEAAGQRVVAKLGIAEDADVLKNLRARSWEEVLAASAAPGVNYAANLSVDGWFLPQSVNEAFAQGKQSDVPLVVGANEGEAGEFRTSIPALAASMKSVTSKAYVYNFTHLPLGWRTPGCYAFHGLELPYVFGNIEGLESETITFLGSAARCPVNSDAKAGEEDVLVANNTMRIWAQFAKTGNPSVPGLIDWPAYAPDTDLYLDIGAKLQVKSGVSASGKTPPPPATTPGAPPATTPAAPAPAPAAPATSPTAAAPTTT